MQSGWLLGEIIHRRMEETCTAGTLWVLGQIEEVEGVEQMEGRHKQHWIGRYHLEDGHSEARASEKDGCGAADFAGSWLQRN